MFHDNNKKSDIYQSEIQTNMKDNINKTDYNIITKRIGTDYLYKHEVVWKNVIGFFILHAMAVWGFLILISEGISYKSALWSKFLFEYYVLDRFIHLKVKN